MSESILVSFPARKAVQPMDRSQANPHNTPALENPKYVTKLTCDKDHWNPSGKHRHLGKGSFDLNIRTIVSALIFSYRAGCSHFKEPVISVLCHPSGLNQFCFMILSLSLVPSLVTSALSKTLTRASPPNLASLLALHMPPCEGS